MANTYTLIQTTTVGSGGQASIEFTAIPQTYTDLLCVLSLRTNQAAISDDIEIQFNTLTTNRSSKTLYGFGAGSASISSSTAIYLTANGATSTSLCFSSGSVYVPNYTGATNKSVLSDSLYEQNTTSVFQGMSTGLWSSTAAITSIKFISAYGTTIQQHSSASLYGIKNS
jgi:hypothetical protein